MAELHRITFPDAAVSQLGQAATERYYRAILATGKGGLSLGIFATRRLAAFCIAGEWDEPEKEFLRRNLGFVACRLLASPRLLFQPFIRDRIRSGLAMLLPKKRSVAPTPAASSAAPAAPSIRSLGILYIGVHPEFRGRGLARHLLARVETFARQNRFDQLDLSVYLENTPAIQLYLSEGWQKRLSGAVWKGFLIKPLA